MNLGPGKAEKSDSVAFRAPSAPFEGFDSRDADRAWRNKRNGNSISYQSTCNDPADPTLEIVQNEMLSALEGVRVLSSEQLTFNARLALSTLAEGHLDGVRTRLALMIFKKNNCTYALSYIGLAGKFEDDRAIFNEFLQSFEAP